MKDEDLIDVNETPTHPAMNEGALKVVEFFKDLDSLNETPEQLAKELCEAVKAKSEAEKVEKRIKEFFKKKYGEGDHMIGGYLVSVSSSEGKRSIKLDAFERYISSILGNKEALEEARKACITKGEDSLRVSAKELTKSSGDLSGGVTGEGL